MTAREPYLTVEDVAEWLSFSRTAIRDAAREHRLPAHKIAGEWRFLESEVRAYLDLDHTAAVRRLTVVPRHRKAIAR